MTAPDSVERVVAEMREAAEAYAGHHASGTFRRLADRLQALARGPQQAGGEDVPEKVVAWMNEREAWRSPRAPSEPGTHALVLADDYAALQAEVARWQTEAMETANYAAERIDAAEAALTKYGAHYPGCDGFANGIDGDCDCGWNLVRDGDSGEG